MVKPTTMRRATNPERRKNNVLKTNDISWPFKSGVVGSSAGSPASCEKPAKGRQRIRRLSKKPKEIK
jgi:hypothetical protein